MTDRKVVLIDKERVAELRFPIEEVLKDADKIKQRKLEAERATLLGNALVHNKVKIIFEDSEGAKQIETTIWGTTDKRILLKGALAIPLHRIHQIKIY